jgi:RNA polymerase sigma-70 factor, ECF subfamily
LKPTTAQNEFLTMLNENQGIVRKVCHLYGRDEAGREDLYQEIVIQLWKAYGSFRGESKLSTWMYRIALNTAISDLRKQNRCRYKRRSKRRTAATTLCGNPEVE